MTISKDESVLFILYVKNQDASKTFYCNLLGLEPILDVPGMTEFQLTDYTILGLMPEDGIVKVLENKIPHPQLANGAPRSEIYLYVDNPDGYYDRLVRNGGLGISKGERRSWGDYVSYGSDLDGHIIAFARR